MRITPSIKKQRVLRGFTFRDPKGNLDWRICHSVESAQSNAAFACERPYSHISLPGDWQRAYKQGFRIVSATLRAGPSNGAWAKLQRELAAGDHK